MSNIYRTDPDVQQKLRRRLAALEAELQELVDQDKQAKELGQPKKPPRMLESLRSRIRQTRLRLKQLEDRKEGAPREQQTSQVPAPRPDTGH